MPTDEPTILATSGGFQPSGRGIYLWKRGPLVDFALALTGAARPRICWLGTAHGDATNGVQGFYSAFAGAADVLATHLALFSMPNVEDVRAHLLAQDVIWVGGGSVANLLAVWRVHALDVILRDAWEAGILLAGVSAGSICWHVGGTTDSFGPELRAVTNGLSLLPYGNGVHYDSEPGRRPLLHALVADGTLPVSYATDDGVGLLYRGTRLVEVLSDRADAAGYRIERRPDGSVEEVRLPTRRLG